VKSYFQLQYTLINRRFKDSGIEPLIGYILILAGFTAFSFSLFNKTIYAKYIYIAIAATALTTLSETKRNEFLQLCLGDRKLRMTRIAENMMAALPFIAFLMYKQLFIEAIALVPLSGFMALARFNTGTSFTIPTPFYKKPFEFTAGFRNSFFLLAGAYGLTVAAAAVGNFNLGIFAILAIIAITCGYYSNPEQEYYVWSYRLKPAQFLFGKLRTALLFSFLLCLPAALLLSIVFYNSTGYVALSMVAGLAFLAGVVTAKYAAYPGKISLPQGFMLAFCVYFPPLLALVIPYFFITAIQRLNRLLP
jgi:hypothetical protein